MKVKDIVSIIENYADPTLAEDYDNVGLLIGDMEQDVNKIFITLDTNITTVKEAVKNGCDMIVSHHPVFFRGIKKIDYSTPEGLMVREIIKNDISLFAAHTNMDSAQGGINDKLAELFKLDNIKVLHIENPNINAGIGRVGELTKSISFKELCSISKEILHTTKVRAAGDFDKVINKLCVASGSCSEYIEDAIAIGCDAVITGDMKYHEMIDYTERGICIIDAGHYPTEIIVMDIFNDILKDTEIEIVKSKNTDIFTFI